MTLPRTAADVLSRHVVFEIESIDRLYLNLYVPELQRVGQVVGFLTRHLGFEIASTALVARRSEAFVEGIRRYARDHDVPLIDFVKGQRKDDVMHEYLARADGREQVLFIGRAQEKTRIFRTQRRRNPTTGAAYPWIVTATAMVNQFYIYAVDDDFGPFFVKFASYFPYTGRLWSSAPNSPTCSARSSAVRDDAGAVPLVAAYDYHERVFNPPLPILFQRRVGTENRAINAPAIRTLLDAALHATGVTEPDGQPLRFVPHDFRRIFITDAVLNGMPPHIAQLVVGHRDINTTMGYKAVYPEEAINGHRAFIARRRQLRPSEEYRTPTEQEWEEFLGHFEHRKVALGSCGRAFGTSCIHEHSCIRCPLLRPDPTQRHRLADIRDNLATRINEAQRERWLGEVEGLKVSLAAANHKLAQLDDLAARRTTIHLGIPAFPEIAGRTLTTQGRDHS